MSNASGTGGAGRVTLPEAKVLSLVGGGRQEGGDRHHPDGDHGRESVDRPAAVPRRAPPEKAAERRGQPETGTGGEAGDDEEAVAEADELNGGGEDLLGNVRPGGP
ncbi:MAG: hypothetical protein P8Y07_15085 [Gemmatimonadales bacterium]